MSKNRTEVHDEVSVCMESGAQLCFQHCTYHYADMRQPTRYLSVYMAWPRREAKIPSRAGTHSRCCYPLPTASESKRGGMVARRVSSVRATG